MSAERTAGLPRRRSAGTAPPVGMDERPELVVRVSSAEWEALKRMADALDVRPTTIVYAAWAVVLARHARGGQVSFDLRGEPRPGTEEGGIRTLRLEPEEEDSVAEWLRRVEAERDRPEAPGSDPTHDPAPSGPDERPGSDAALRTLLCSWRSEPASPAPPGEGPEHDFRLHVIAGREGLTLRADTPSGRMSASDAVRFLEYLRRVVGGMIAYPNGAPADLPMLSEEELRTLTHEWNPPSTPFPGARPLHQMFEACAARTPDAPAVVCEDRSWTYGELNEKANHLAHLLRARGVGPDIVVGMCFDRSREMVLGLLGILKAGGAYLPLDASLPKERLAFMLEDSKTPMVVTRSDLADVLPGTAPAVILVDAPNGEEGAEATSDPDPISAPEHLAYVIYTSGSTGRPKGVGVEHRQVTNYVLGLGERLGITPGTSCATVTTLSADLGNTSIFSALAWGGCLHVISEDRIFNGTALAEYFQAHAIDLLKITPSHLAALQGGSEPGSLVPRRWLVLGGEATSLDWIAEWARAAPDCEIHNHYGPTETTVGVLTYRIPGPLPDTDSGTLPIGRPLPNSRMYVVDARLRLVPIGVPGELLVGGEGVTRGYLGSPELTAEKFVRLPLDDGRLYRTGDLVRYLPDGNLEFLGRIDAQVKIRGFRVEPGEIEVLLREHPAVRECAVVAREDPPGEKRLVAYVVGEKVEPGVLREHLGAKLQDHMVPSGFIFLHALPLTPNGKLDRKALPAQVVSTREYVAPRDDTERWLARTWEEILDVEGVGIHDDFFSLGGHSLLAVQLFTRVGRKFGVQLPLAALFSAPTIEACAAMIRNGSEGGLGSAPTWRHLVAIQSSGSGRPIFCVAGIGGHVLNLHGLAQHLGRGQPFYGIQSLGVDGVTPPFTRMEDMARAYLEEVRAVQPRGPYRLVGFSAGGIPAFEMAHQLVAAGESVELLAILDSFCPGVPPPPPAAASAAASAPASGARARSRVRRLRRQLGELRRNGLAHPYGILRRRLRKRFEKRVLPHLIRLAALPDEVGIRLRRRWDRPLTFRQRQIVIERATLEALSSYDVRPLPGRAVVFSAADHTPRGFRHLGRDRGWGGFLEDGVEVRDVPGGHHQVLTPPNDALVARGILETLRSTR